MAIPDEPPKSTPPRSPPPSSSSSLPAFVAPFPSLTAAATSGSEVEVETAASLSDFALSAAAFALSAAFAIFASRSARFWAAFSAAASSSARFVSSFNMSAIRPARCALGMFRSSRTAGVSLSTPLPLDESLDEFGSANSFSARRNTCVDNTAFLFLADGGAPLGQSPGLARQGGGASALALDSWLRSTSSCALLNVLKRLEAMTKVTAVVGS
mmetsp:Transcript_5400/g.11342  ORF Transcript_5400/g.11342 Transcript_5400/m.11342 type:complete len:213 (-) Transcript_5400:1064-1702(-)|eukprot:CAMPEP_0171885012 /NCGR_PEP_ID=MMETSP0992-20121227/41101_1 /TAXON_ID=483369 /ORGANISM="non described non described, Strain CCMP2098" /LENGTH=212 /DNA_ID=CAMNT_0012511497 /DNA_START=45 /DNA_END=683 /DNA_ORIENTATION=+